MQSLANIYVLILVKGERGGGERESKIEKFYCMVIDT